MNSFLKKLSRLIALIGPGLFCLGFTIGTGSVTTMVKSGGEFGTALLPVLAVSAFFTWVMTEAYGRFGVVTGKTAVHGIKTTLKGGKTWAIILISGLVVSQWISLSSILNIVSNAVAEVLSLCIPSMSGGSSYLVVLIIAVILAGTVWFLLNKGNYSTFEKILSGLVTVMGLAFILSMFIKIPDPETFSEGFSKLTAPDANAGLFIAAFVGTTMSSPTFVIRPLILKSKGWGHSEQKIQKRDAIVSASLTFLISGAIMITAAGVLFPGKIDTVLEMTKVLGPIGGRFAVALFIVGLIAAGLSSIFPIMMLAAVLVSDYNYGEMKTGTKSFKLLTGISALVGLTIPILGYNPVITQVASQVTLVFVLPLVITLMLVIINKKEIMGDARPGIAFNICMILALIFACVVSYTGVEALGKLLN